jgi:xanthine dehydrogenase/oxidase
MCALLHATISADLPMPRASVQVRSVGTVGGNLMLGNLYDTFPSDIGLLFEMLGTSITVADATATSPLTMAQFIGYPSAMTGKVLVSFSVPPAGLSAGQRELCFSHKAMLRKVNSHAIVNFALRLVVTTATNTIVSATLRYGGIARGQYVAATAAESALAGTVLGDNAQLQVVLTALDAVAALADPAFERTAFRQSLVKTLFYKGMLQAAAALDASASGGTPILPPSAKLAHAAANFVRPISSGVWEVSGGETPALYPLTQPGLHKPKAMQQVTGTAPFTDDVPQPAGQLHGVFVLSNVIGTLTSIDTSAAAAVTGVVAIITAQTLAQHSISNILASNCTEEVLADSAVPYMGCRLALVLARTEQIADEAARLVVANITASPSANRVVTLEHAVAARTFFDDTPGTLIRGDAEAVMRSAAHTVSGRASCDFQYHFHMETQICRAAPDGNGGISILGALQAPTHTATHVSTSLGLQATQVECRTERSGGGFGAKYSHGAKLAVAAAAACKITNAPVSIKLSLNDNMASLGGRRPHLWDYTVGCTSTGRIVAVTGNTYTLQGGASDMGGLVESADMWDTPGNKYEGCSIDGPYSIANWNLNGYCAQSSMVPLTYFRGPFRLPGHILIESVIENVAHATGLTPHAVREANLYEEGDVTPCGQMLVHNNLRSCVNAAKARADLRRGPGLPSLGLI